MYIRKTAPSFSREQRAGFVLVIVTGCLAMLLGLFYVGRHVVNPFSVEYSGPVYLSNSEEQLLETLRQKQSDTDNDSLSDYDELYIYKTSPYLQDTDGDTYTDETEINSGSDPTCAQGEDCQTTEDIGGNSADNLLGLTGENDNETTATIEQIQQAISGLSVSEIRQLLLDSGADVASVNAMSDEEVKSLFSSVISDLSLSGELEDVIQGSLQ